MQTCSVCQVEKHGLVFKTDYDKKHGTTSTPDFVRTRICCHARNKGCINGDGKVNKALDYNDQGITTEIWLDVARKLIEEHKNKAIATTTSNNAPQL
jgi:hypothetical protein